MSPPYIDCFLRPGAWFHARPASPKREWMDNTPHQHAYRCLPLIHANQHGWEILLKQGFTAEWNGGPTQKDLQIRLEGNSPDGSAPIVSAFGSGIITFHIPCLISTPKDVNLWVTGLPNSYKDGVQPLTAVVETDWYQESGFTMSWKITRPNHPIHFSLHEPICFFFPIPRGYVESFQPRLRSFDSDTQRMETYYKAEKRRLDFQKNLSITQEQETIIPGEKQKKQWQRHYFEGKKPDGTFAHGHQTKLSIKPFQIEEP